MIFVPVHPPRNPDECPQWLHEAIKRLNRQATTAEQGFGAILRGETPDASGTPLIDSSQFFVKPGLSGGQIAYGGKNASENLTLGSTANASKGFIYFGAAGAFDEANKRFGIGTLTPAAKLEIHQTGTNVGYGPNSTVSGTPQWRGQDSGSSLHTYVNESVASDANYITDGTNLGVVVRLGLPNIPAQLNTATITISFRMGWFGTNGGSVGISTLNLILKDGSAGTPTIHTDAHGGFVPSGAHGDVAFTTFSFTLTVAEINTINANSGWNGMTLEIDSGGGGIGYAGSLACSWMALSLVGATAVDLIRGYDTSDTLRFSVSRDGLVTTPQLILSGSTSGTLTLIPAATTTSYSLTFPSAQGAAGSLLQNNGSGVLSFVSPASLATRIQHRWTANGPYRVGTNVDTGFIPATAFSITAVWIVRLTPGSASSTIVDFNKNGTTMYTTQANRPTIAFNDADNKVQATLPDIVSVAAGDILTFDIDQIETGTPADFAIIIEGA